MNFGRPKSSVDGQNFGALQNTPTMTPMIIATKIATPTRMNVMRFDAPAARCIAFDTFSVNDSVVIASRVAVD